MVFFFGFFLGWHGEQEKKKNSDKMVAFICPTSFPQAAMSKGPRLVGSAELSVHKYFTLVAWPFLIM